MSAFALDHWWFSVVWKLLVCIPSIQKSTNENQKATPAANDISDARRAAMAARPVCDAKLRAWPAFVTISFGSSPILQSPAPVLGPRTKMRTFHTPTIKSGCGLRIAVSDPD